MCTCANAEQKSGNFVPVELQGRRVHAPLTLHEHGKVDAALGSDNGMDLGLASLPSYIAYGI